VENVWVGLSIAVELGTAENQRITPDYSARRTARPGEAAGFRFVGFGAGSTSPLASHRSSWIGLGRAPSRRLGDMVILMVTSFFLNAERNFTATS
jgi:hypothetical protein